MPDMTLDGTVVAICDWRGRVIWISDNRPLAQLGDLAWQHLAEDCQEEAKIAFARVVSLREEATLELQNNLGQWFRSWLWPLASPEIAVCALSISIPDELRQLTAREREVLGLLAQGRNTREIAELLEVSSSTIQTHLRRSREKLSLPSVEALIGFAARYCHPKEAPALKKPS